ncbi:MAG: pyridoxal-phosphate dependent enzyme [Bernardetiaceae bacterium]|nr:pyridoxal-phosphate dependent enzyme [Bernardetiaceae bacterium]
MKTNFKFVASETGSIYPPTHTHFTTVDILNLHYNEPHKPLDLSKMQHRPFNFWRYEEVLPAFPKAQRVSLGEGISGLLPKQINRSQVWLKSDYLFPTGSYKDRGAAMLLTHAQWLGVSSLVQDSSGNAGCAVAAYAAAAQIHCKIFVPEATAEAKLIQIKSYGADLQRIAGTREDTANAAAIAAQNAYYASHCYNPLFYEGTKTFFYEVFEQFKGELPEVFLLPAGNGTLILGAIIAFRELLAMQLIANMPKIIALQTEACAPIYQAFSQGNCDIKGLHTPSVQDSYAEGIAIAAPARATQILEAVRQTGGEVITIQEQEIMPAWKKMAKQGLFIEPTSAALMAALHQVTLTEKGNRIVAPITGHGLKAVDKLSKFV